VVIRAVVRFMACSSMPRRPRTRVLARILDPGPPSAPLSGAADFRHRYFVQRTSGIATTGRATGEALEVSS
jgi:hypothetical protein